MAFQVIIVVHYLFVDYTCSDSSVVLQYNNILISSCENKNNFTDTLQIQVTVCYVYAEYSELNRLRNQYVSKL